MTISKFIVDMNFKKIIVKVNYHTSYIVREKIIYWEKVSFYGMFSTVSY